MMTLLHGDTIEASRAELLRLKSAAKGKEIRVVSGKSIDTGALIQALESQSLFGGDTLVVIEALFSNIGKKPSLAKELAAILSSVGQDTEIILWEGKELSEATVRLLGKSTVVRLFKTPTVLFAFLDSLGPGSHRDMLALWNKARNHDASELLFAMIVRRVRQLIQVYEGIVPAGVSDWQMARLTNQAKCFTMKKLLSMSRELLAIEYSIKSGSSPVPMSQQLELFLVSI